MIQLPFNLPPKKLLIVVVLLLLAIISIAVLLFLSRPTITITTTPDQALISIDNKQPTKSPTTITLAKGNHFLTIAKPDYFTETLNLTVSSSQTYHFNLTPTPKVNFNNSVPTPSSPQAAFSLTESLAIDPTTKTLVINNLVTGTQTPLSPQPQATINNFSYSAATNIIFIETEAFPSSLPHQYYFINRNTKTLTQVNLNLHLPISSFSMSPDGTTIAFFGNYDIHTNLSQLFLLNTSTLVINPITDSQIKASQVSWINNDLLLLTLTKDAPNQDTAQVFARPTNKVTNIVSPPNYFRSITINPLNPTLAYISQDGLVLHQLLSNQTTVLAKKVDPENKLRWLDDHILLLLDTSTRNQPKITKIDTTTQTISLPVTLDLAVNQVFSTLYKVGDQLYAVVYNTQTQKTELVPVVF